jgi:hypothetical protein
MDLLKEVYLKKMSEDDAFDLYEKIRIEADNKATANNQKTYDLGQALGMDNEEYSASCHGLPYKVLAKWRYEGWPTKTIDTGEEIDYKNDNWLVECKNRKYGLIKL